MLAYLAFPARHPAKLHSVNPLERLNGEVKCRTDVVGIFANGAAITRLVGALLLERKAFQLLFATEDQQEGMNAFLEKRAAAYSGS